MRLEYDRCPGYRDESCESVEERLAEAARVERLRMRRGPVRMEPERYGGVEEYDAVLRSHCRLGEEE